MVKPERHRSHYRSPAGRLLKNAICQVNADGPPVPRDVVSWDSLSYAVPTNHDLEDGD